MSKAAEVAAGLSAAERAVLLRVDAGYAFRPGAWTVSDYEIIERSPKLYKPVFVSRQFGWGHMLTAFGKRVQDAAIAMEAAKPDRPRSGLDPEGDSAGRNGIAQTPHPSTPGSNP
jgi:hypothetical protein